MNFFSDNTRVRIFIFFPEFNIKFHDKNSESDYYFFPPRKSEYFIQQHWESEYFLEKKHKGDMFRSCVLSYIQYIFLYCEQSFSLFKCIKCSSIVTNPNLHEPIFQPETQFLGSFPDCSNKVIRSVFDMSFILSSLMISTKCFN